LGRGRVRAAARAAANADQVRRLLAIAAVYDGKDRAAAAQIGAMERQTLRDWVPRFNAAGPVGLIDRKPPGVKRRLTADQEAELVKLIEDGPEVARDGVVRWRCVDLQRVIRARWDLSYPARTIGKILRRLEFRHRSVRPRHLGQKPAEIEAFKKTLPPRSVKSRPRSRRRRG
jgi:transposase